MKNLIVLSALLAALPAPSFAGGEKPTLEECWNALSVQENHPLPDMSMIEKCQYPVIKLSKLPVYKGKEISATFIIVYMQQKALMLSALVRAMRSDNAREQAETFTAMHTKAYQLYHNETEKHFYHNAFSETEDLLKPENLLAWAEKYPDLINLAAVREAVGLWAVRYADIIATQR